MESDQNHSDFHPIDNITFLASFVDNNTLLITFIDDQALTEECLILVYENGSLFSTINVNYHFYSGLVESVNHSSYDYKVVLEIYNHSALDDYSRTIILPKWSAIPSLISDIDLSLDSIISNPLGWISCFAFGLGLFIILSFGRRFAGVGIAGVSGVLVLVQGILGVLDPLGLIAIPLFLLMGALVQISIAKKRRYMG
jgi:hypothetical protein